MLTRSVRERVFIEHKGETLEIVIADINGKEARIGFQGSKSFNIKRDDMIKEINGNK